MIAADELAGILESVPRRASVEASVPITTNAMSAMKRLLSLNPKDGRVQAMDRQNAIQYWIVSAENDWKVAGHLLEKRDYGYALFFGHLTLEKYSRPLSSAVPANHPL